MSSRGKKMLKESLFVKDDPDILGDNPVKTRNTADLRSRRSRQLNGKRYDNEKGVPGMDVVDESERVNLDITGRDLHTKNVKKKDRINNIQTALITLILVTVFVIIGLVVYNIFL